MSAPKTWRLTAFPLDGDGDTGDLIADQAGPLLAVVVRAAEQIGAWAETVTFEGKREGGNPSGLAGVDITLEPVDLDEPLRLIEEFAELRCPACCSPEVGDCRDSSLPGWLQCGNCGERFERDSVLVSLGDAETYSTRLKLGLKVLTHGDEGFDDLFGAEAEVDPLGPIPPAVQARLDELDRLAAPGSTLALARDWEGIIVGMFDGDEHFESLYFSDEGDIAHGGINLPHYVKTVAELLAL